MADLETLLNAVGDRLRTIAGLKVYTYLPDSIEPPAAIVQAPREIRFDFTFGRGSDEYTVPVLLLVSKPSDRAGATALYRYMNPSGPTSIKQAVDGNLGGLGDARATRAYDPGVYPFNGIDFLGVRFDIDIAG